MTLGERRAPLWRSRSRVLGLAFALFVLAAATAVAVVWRLGSALVAPALRSIGDPPAGFSAASVAFASASGSMLQGWLARGAPGRGAVVLAHSVRSNRLEMVERARFLVDAGYSALLFDAQAHGESPGEQITFGYLESRDARAAVDYLRAALPRERIGYLGVSQGGAAALLGDTPLAVDALLLEAVYPTLREATLNRIRIRAGPLAPLLAPLLLAQVGPRLGIDQSAIAPIEGMRRVRAPVFVIAGERDEHTLLTQSQRLFDAAPEPKSFWIVPGAAHVDFHRSDTAEYERRVLAFLSRALRERGT